MKVSTLHSFTKKAYPRQHWLSTHKSLIEDALTVQTHLCSSCYRYLKQLQALWPACSFLPTGEVLLATKQSSLVILVRSSSHPAFTALLADTRRNAVSRLTFSFLCFGFSMLPRQLQTFIPQRRRRRGCREADRKTQLPPRRYDPRITFALLSLLGLRYAPAKRFSYFPWKVNPKYVRHVSRCRSFPP